MLKQASKLGEGSCFTIVLPFRIDSTPKRKAEVIEETNIDISGLHVLIVEDNELNMEIAQFMLENEGVKIDKAFNGQEAIERFKLSESGTYDVIFMDVMMPVMDGLTATKLIRNSDHPDAKTVSIIAMTANAFREDAKECIDAGMNAHMAKPLDIQMIKKAIYKSLNRN